MRATKENIREWVTESFIAYKQYEKVRNSDLASQRIAITMAELTVL